MSAQLQERACLPDLRLSPVLAHATSAVRIDRSQNEVSSPEAGVIPLLKESGLLRARYVQFREVDESASRYMKNAALFDELKEIALLDESWDAEGAAKINREALGCASALIGTLPPALPMPTIAPNPHGTISFYWKSNLGWAELEIGRTRHSWIVSTEDKREVCSGDNEHLEGPSIQKLSGALYRLTAVAVCQGVVAGEFMMSPISMDHDWRECDYAL